MIKEAWLDRLSGETGADISPSDEVAPAGWLPTGITSRLKNENMYVMTLVAGDSFEILGVIASNGSIYLERGLEETEAISAAAGSTVFQSLTARHLEFLTETAVNTETYSPVNYRMTIGIDSSNDESYERLGFIQRSGLGKLRNVVFPYYSDPVLELYWIRYGQECSLIIDFEVYFKLNQRRIRLTIADQMFTFGLSGEETRNIIITEDQFNRLPKSGFVELTVEFL